MAGETPGHTLSATALAHEAFAKLFDRIRTTNVDPIKFRALAATAIRHILIDHARAKRTAKRGKGASAISLEDHHALAPDRRLELLELDEALRRLARENERQAQVVELRFFGGFTITETADLLEIAPRSVNTAWQKAQLRLRQLLANDIEPA